MWKTDQICGQLIRCVENDQIFGKLIRFVRNWSDVWGTGQTCGKLIRHVGNTQNYTNNAFEPIPGVELNVSSGLAVPVHKIVDNRQIVTNCLSCWQPTMCVHKRGGLRGPRPE